MIPSSHRSVARDRVGQASLSHAEARQIVRQAWTSVWGREPTASELDYAQAIALLETGYGRSGQFAQMAANGQFNWGALERSRSADGTCPPGTSPGVDAGNPRCFFVFSSDVAAAAAFIRLLTKSHWPVVQAMSGSPRDVAQAMKVSPAYYEAPVDQYAAAITNALARIRASGASTVTPRPATGAALGTLVGLGALAIAGWVAWQERDALAAGFARASRELGLSRDPRPRRNRRRSPHHRQLPSAGWVR